MTELGILPGFSSSAASAINNSGQVVGQCDTGDNYSHAFLYSGGAMIDLGTLPGGSYADALGINDGGQVVGYSSIAGGDYHAFLYSAGTMADLNSLVTLPGGAYLNGAYGINDLGEIAANGSNGHAYLLTLGNSVLTVVNPFADPATRQVSPPTLTMPASLATVLSSPPATSLAADGESAIVLAYQSRSPQPVTFTLSTPGIALPIGKSAGSLARFDPNYLAAYSLNVTVVPRTGELGYLTTWPTGQTQPLASTLNSPAGEVVANAALVPAGTNGNISIYASDATDVLFDINGYFAPPAAGLQFYPLTPCRVADTRVGTGFTGSQGPPYLSGGTSRNFQVAGLCGVPSTAAAYSLNVTVVPRTGELGYLTTWPTGQTQPWASTLNSPAGAVVANAALVPAGASGDISIYASDATDVLFDINGYFAPPGTGGLDYYTMTPCRVADTRSWAGFAGQLGPPTMGAATSRSFPVQSSVCNVPSVAAAYSFNVTVVPSAGTLGYLTTWPTGQPQPWASTLNSPDGMVVANAALVPAGTGGAISIYVSNPTDVLFDISGYFAPGQ